MWNSRFGALPVTEVNMPHPPGKFTQSGVLTSSVRKSS